MLKVWFFVELIVFVNLISTSLNIWWGATHFIFLLSLWSARFCFVVSFTRTKCFISYFNVLLCCDFRRIKHFKPILMFHFIVNFARIEHFISYFNVSFCYEFCKNQAIPSRFYLGNFVVQSFKSLWCFSPCWVLHPICLFVVFVIVAWWIGREGL
jgi:hypothetical protein